MVQTSHGQLLVNYSPIRKQGMKMHGREDCSALITLLKLIMEKNHVHVQKVDRHPDKMSDLSIEFMADTTENIQQLRSIIQELIKKRIGAENIAISLTSE